MDRDSYYIHAIGCRLTPTELNVGNNADVAISDIKRTRHASTTVLGIVTI